MTEIRETPTATDRRQPPPAAFAVAATVALAATTLLSYLVTGGAPNPAMASIAVLPLLAAFGYLRSARWAAVPAVLTVVTLLVMRTADLSHDLARPGEILPFLVAAATVLASGVVLVAAVPGLLAGARSLVVGLPLGAVLGLGLVLVSPQLDDTGALTPDQVAALPTVAMVDFKFEPGQLTVAEGRPVAFRFTNDTDGSHSFAIESLGIDVTVPAGRTRTVVVDLEPGVYPFVCSVGSHEENGMVGRLTVTGEGDAAGHDGHAGVEGEGAAEGEGTGHDH
ncbi:cupredoxin domain-containing protein [Nocardiopsis protaetiae]|uniref:cupredoxin domain-containing protein n=1 Tax=Nocardiopsis protaetiae TaxID=3382270 RepID=UPI00387AD913